MPNYFFITALHSYFQNLAKPMNFFLALMASYIHYVFTARQTFANYGLKLVNNEAKRGTAEELPPSPFLDAIAKTSKFHEFARKKLVPEFNRVSCHVLNVL